jgi:hypothetical protein
VEVVLERGLFIEGTAVEGASVVVVAGDPSSGGAPGPWSAGPGGAFRAGPLPAGTYRLIVSSGDTSAEVEDVAAGARGLRVRPTDEGAIRGRVLDAAGEPVPSASINLTHVAGRTTMGTGGRADAEGRFSLAAVKDRTYVLEADADGKGRARLESVAGGTRDVVLRLGAAQAGSLSGRVLDGEGRPAAGIRVRARTATAGAGMLEHVLVGPAAADPGGAPPPLLRQEDIRDARTDAAGAFDFGPMPAGRWVVWAGEPGSAVRPTGAVRFEGSGGPVELRVAGGWTLRGRLLDEAGAPRLFVLLEIRSRDSLPAPLPSFLVTVPTGRGGSFEVPGLPPGPVKVTECNAQPAPSWTVEEQGAGAEPVPLTLRR